MRTGVQNMLGNVPLVLALALLGLTVTIGVWDVYAIFSDPARETVSSIVYAWGREFPPLVIFIGFLLGHLFWPVHNPHDLRQ